MERLFRFIDRILLKSISAWAVYLISVVLNQVGESSVIKGKESFLDRMVDLTNASVFILYAFTVAIVILVVLYLCLKPIAFKKQPSTYLTDIMRRHTDDSLKTDVCGGLSWGMNKTVAKPGCMVVGWKPDHVMIERYDPTMFSFSECNKEGDILSKEHEAFCNSDSFRSVIRCGNDLTRYMITRFRANVNKTDPRLIVDLRKTEWNQTSFVWDKARNNYAWKQDQIKSELNTGRGFLPNSLCLHLMIETSDGKVLVSGISASKENDYPSSKAVSIGEQIELSDFVNSSNFADDFISIWVERAVKEEFGLNDKLYYQYFNKESIRVLGLDIEGDIINYSIPCVIKMNATCEQFKQVINTTIDTKEISFLDSLALKDIPYVLLQWNDENERKNWHPSSYLRLLLFLIHHKGYNRTAQMLKQAEESYQKRKR